MVDFAALILYNRGMRDRIKFKYEIESATKSYSWLRWLFDSARFNLTLMLLILLSVVLILVETFVPMPLHEFDFLQRCNDFLTLIFVIELGMRWLISISTHAFLRDFWIDMLAVIPMFRIFRVGRILRLLRLFRVFSLGAYVQRRFLFFQKIFTGRLLEYAVISSFAIFAIIFGAVGFSQFETGHDSVILTPVDAFWKSLFSMMAGEYADYPISFGGKLVFLVLLIFQMGVFAMLTGTFSAIMYDKLKESAMNKMANPEDLDKHIIICGFSAKAAILATEFLIDPAFKHSEILMVSEKANLEDLQRRKIKTHRISILKEDFTRMELLKKQELNGPSLR